MDAGLMGNSSEKIKEGIGLENGLTNVGKGLESGLQKAGDKLETGLTNAGQSIGKGFNEGLTSTSKGIGYGLAALGASISLAIVMSTLIYSKRVVLARQAVMSEGLHVAYRDNLRPQVSGYNYPQGSTHDQPHESNRDKNLETVPVPNS